MSDFNFCRNCQKIVGIIDEFYCQSCGEMMCAVCGCTDSEPCAEVCGWTDDGLCSNCADDSEDE